MAKEYRSKNRIVLDLLKSVKEQPGLGRSALLTLSNLSTDRLQGYLSDLVQGGLLQEETARNHRTYQITPTGQRFLAELDKLDRFMSDFGMSL